MKLAALILAAPLVFGAGLASAQTATTTEKTVTTPLGSVESKTTTDHDTSWDGKRVEKSKSTTENPDGTVTTERSKTVNKSD